MSAATRPPAPSGIRPSAKQFAAYTLLSAAVAAAASTVSTALAFEVWVMFAGFIAWFTRPSSIRDGLSALACMWLGIGLGAAAYWSMHNLTPTLGALAVPIVVFLVALLIVGLRTTAFVNNMLAWFLGLVTFFAAHIEIAPAPILELVAASAIGGLAAWASVTVTHRFAPAH
ncbi:DUF1097 domain-containing protein [Mycolicibacterium baixiangningiae]|uniref:DUF1097 domain-containing protein n=1 Tax=Mycolicibacterium baixiangningiae TaxID=2761578 RepID=UPI0018D15F88|nr:DUF1097 domain-containing protein [Mycolicibacterium baixiangningiae]